jgi:hypothetical protein
MRLPAKSKKHGSTGKPKISVFNEKSTGVVRQLNSLAVELAHEWSEGQPTTT